MPKKNPLLKLLRLGRLGRLTYQRLIPVILRPCLGNKATIRRTLGVDSADCANTSALTAYARVHGQIQGVIDAAEAQHQQKSAVIQPHPQSFALTPRDVAGIAANPLLEMRNAIADGRTTTPIQEELTQIVPEVLAQMVWTQMTGDTSHIQQALAQLTQPLLDQLGISPDETDMKAITQRLFAMAAMSDCILSLEALIKQHATTDPDMLQVVCGSDGVAVANAATTYKGAIIQCDNDEVIYDYSVEEIDMDNN